jgi:hypothetical protein
MIRIRGRPQQISNLGEAATRNMLGATRDGLGRKQGSRMIGAGSGSQAFEFATPTFKQRGVCRCQFL